MSVAKGQKKSNREAKKPKKTDAERKKASQAISGSPFAPQSEKDAAKKT
jgi:hypothetical protein